MPSPAPLILASGSARRRELLARAGVPFEVRPPDIPERREPGEPPGRFASRLALEKARAVASRAGAPGRLVLGADTIVVVDDDVLGKPRDVEHAAALLSRLVGRSHRVLTAVALVESGSDAARHTLATELPRGLRDEIKDFPGVTGSIQFDEKGDVTKFPRVYVIGKDLLLYDMAKQIEQRKKRAAEDRKRLEEKLRELRENAAKIGNGS